MLPRAIHKVHRTGSEHIERNITAYVDKNWKRTIKVDWESLFSNPFPMILTMIITRFSGSFLDFWKMLVSCQMYMERTYCPVCKTLQRKQKEKHLVAHCPICLSPCHQNGSVRGTPRFTCENTRSHKMNRKKNFTLNTCYEHIYFRWFCSLRVLELLGNGSSLTGIMKLTGTTRHFLDLVISAASKQAREKGILRKRIKQNFLAVYIDGTYVLRGCTLIAKVEEQIFWRCATAEDSETIRKMLLELKEVISVKNLIFVTDGLTSYIKPIAELFPEAIHVRHFHSTWEDILIHFKQGNGRFTLHTKSDILIHSGCKEISLWKGIKTYLNRKSKKRYKQAKNPLKELLVVRDQIKMLSRWDGRLMQKLSCWLSKVSDAIIDGRLPPETEQIVKDEIKPMEMPLKFRERVRIRMEGFESRIKNKERKYRLITKSETVEMLAKGDLGDVANKFPFVKGVFDILKQEFDGKHITSNPVEGAHSLFLPYLHTHRTVKGTSRLIELILHLLYSGRTAAEILPFEAYISAEVTRTREKRMHVGKFYFIKYTDRHRNRTERVIKVWDMDKKYIKAWCYKKEKPRDFRRNRIEYFEEREMGVSLIGASTHGESAVKA